MDLNFKLEYHFLFFMVKEEQTTTTTTETRTNKLKNAQRMHTMLLNCETKHIRYIIFNGLILNEHTSLKTEVGANDDAWFQRINDSNNKTMWSIRIKHMQ